MTWKVKDLTSQRFGRLTVIKEAGRNARGKALWLCRCDCGNETIVEGCSLTSGNTRSCGCFGRERSSEANKTHGMKHTRIYRVWSSMKTRCANPNHCHYQDYGGRGITVCDEWIHSFEAFRDWAILHGYTDDLQIDRIDNDGGYSPENCRFVTPAKNDRNRRNNHLMTANGRTLIAADWAKRLGVTESTVCKHARNDSDGGVSWLSKKIREETNA
jgi:hypothetical protein